MMQPMAVATIGGLLYATAMTLFVVPILYDLLHRNKDITKEDLDSPEIA
jgi:HAE1 family hydrophobic/amphiphilic exporter-1